jgi:SET domain
MLGRSLLFIAWTVISAVAEEAGEASGNDTCGLYLAISSTSTAEATKWGMFAGKDIPVDSKIGSPEIGVMIPHLRANMRRAQGDESEEDADKASLGAIVDFFEEFFWVPDTAAAKGELASGRSIAAVPGAGVLASYYTKSTNADWDPAHAYFRPLLGEESGVAHPNRGANSPFYNIQVVSKSEIAAGSEIFIEYGDSWAEKEESDDLTKDDFTKIDETVQQMIEFFDKYKGSLDEDSALEIYSFLTKDIMKAAIGAAKARKVATILPPKPADLHLVPAAGGALKYSDPTVHRNLEWLEKYGLCMDNLRAGASTIPNAGRGAFATRKIPAGGLVAPVPLAHIPNKKVLNMYKLTSTSEEGHFARASDQVVSQQLLLNYCYGHPKSSMLFFPTGSVAAMINHADEPNAKLVWSQHPNNQKMWMQQGPDELADEDHLFIGLVMEIVATRDIAPDEEVFIDYGPEWKDAYKKHVDAWNAKVASGDIKKEWPLRAVDMNAQYHTTGKPFATKDEIAATKPYPENVTLKGFLLILETDNAGTMEDPKVWGEGDDDTAYHHDHLFDMTVLARAASEDANDPKGPFKYTVEWINNLGRSTIVSGVPHDALVFIDKPGTGDQFATEHAFRHYIGIPDEIFPTGPWRNL